MESSYTIQIDRSCIPWLVGGLVVGNVIGELLCIALERWGGI